MGKSEIRYKAQQSLLKIFKLSLQQAVSLNVDKERRNVKREGTRERG